jgi:XTP/dITP diphosphohydrolase
VKQVVLATRNKGKIAEFERLLTELASDIHVLGLSDFPDMPDVEESGTTLEENALLKSRAIAAFTGLPSLADDSGLFVNALGGDPGVYSARWAGTHGDDVANTQKVLGQMRTLAELDPALDRSASFKCVIALSFPAGHAQAGKDLIEQGEMPGALIESPRGEHGFGYDPIFVPAGLTLTSAQLSAQEKDSISHRGRAMRQIAPILIELL